jgi:hypothetical protein
LSDHGRFFAHAALEVDFFKGVLCAGDCAGHGVCLNGVCECVWPWAGVGCGETEAGTLAIALSSDLMLHWRVDPAAGMLRGDFLIRVY